MALTLTELEALRDKILRGVDIASLRFSDGRQKDFITDKRQALAILDERIATLQSTTLRRTVVRTKKGW